MESHDFFDESHRAYRSTFGVSAPVSLMSRELSKAADEAAEKIRASFGLTPSANPRNVNKAKAKLKPR